MSDLLITEVFDVANPSAWAVFHSEICMVKEEKSTEHKKKRGNADFPHLHSQGGEQFPMRGKPLPPPKRSLAGCEVPSFMP